MASGRFLDYMGQGLAVDLPATPDIPADGIAIYYATDDEELFFWGGDPTPAWVQIPLGTLATDFLTLTDTPDAYTAFAGFIVTVNGTEDALEFTDPVDLQLTTEQVQDMVGPMFHNGTGITAAYDDVNGEIDIDCTITQYTDGMADARIAAASVGDLDDVDLTGVTDGDTLVWDTDHFEPGSLSAGSIDDLTDVDTTTTPPTDNQLLTFDTADNLWKPAARSGIWTHAGSWTFASNVPNVDFDDLAPATDILVVARNITLSVSGLRLIQLSVDNGSTFYNTSGDYIITNTSGVEGASTGGSFHETVSTSARSGTVLISGTNVTGPPKPIMTYGVTSHRLFVASPNPINAIRITGSGGGNMTGGSIDVYTRI